MMQFFDFLYYFIYKFYAGHKEAGAQSSSSGIVGGFQASNALTILMFLSLELGRRIKESDKIAAVVLFVFFQITTYIRYMYSDKHSIEVIFNKWQTKSSKWQSTAKVFLWLYGIVSIVGCIGLAIYMGAKGH